MLDRQPGDELDVLARENPAGRVLGRVDDDHPGPGRDQAGKLLQVHPEVALLAQPDAHREGADEVHQRGVDRVAGVGQDHLVAPLHAGQQREEEHVLGARYQHHLGRVGLHSETRGHESRDRLAHLHDPARRGVVRVARVHCRYRRFDDVVGGREIRLADLEVDDLAAFGLQPPGPGQHLEGAFCAQARHALGELHAV